MKAFFIYMICLVFFGYAIEYIAGAFFASFADAIFLTFMGALMIFDLKFANPKWSGFRRIFPNVKWRHLIVWCVPIVFMGVSSVGPAFLEGHTVAFFGLFGFCLMAMPLYLLTQLYTMREGSKDDISWATFNKMAWRERFERYLGIYEAERT